MHPWGQDDSSICLKHRADTVPQLFIPKFLQERTGPPRVLTQACMGDKPRSKTARPVNTRDNQMVKGKGKNTSNRNLGYLEPTSPTTTSPGYPNTPEKQDYDLNSHLMMMIEDFKKGTKNFLKEMQENTSKQVKSP